MRRNLALQGKTLGIPIYIEEVARTDRLFHQYKMNSEITQWQMANVKCSPVLREVSKDPGFEDLLSKVYRMTRLQQLHPKTSYVEKMTVMKRVQTQINIARSHGLPLLPNKASSGGLRRRWVEFPSHVGFSFIIVVVLSL